MKIKEIISRYRQKLDKHKFIQNVMTLMTGTILAQVLTALISPVLTRLYTPSDFGVYALFLSICSVLAVAVAGRYELAIILPEKREDGLSVVVLCGLLAILMSLILMLIMVFGGGYISLLLNAPNLKLWLLFIPINTFMAVMYQALYYWFNRTQQYSIMSRSRVLSAILNVSGSVTFGVYNLGVAGLVLGSLLGQSITVAVMAYVFLKQERVALSSLTIKNIRRQAIRYIDFPKFLIVSHSINAFSSQLPVILLNTFFGVTIVGYFSLAQRVVSMPLSFIGQSVGDVFRQRASDEYKITTSCPIIYKKTLKTLAGIGILPCIALFLVAPQLFGLVFGEAWIEAGRYTSYLSIMFYFELISSPLSMMFMIAEKQRIDLLFQLFRVCVNWCSLFIGYSVFAQPAPSIFLYSVGFAIVHIVNMIFTSRWAKVNLFRLLQE